MTRCYEPYCSIHILESCKSDRQMRYIYEYIDFMKENGVKFDKTSEDKELFEKLQKEEGTERAITRQYTEPLHQGAIETSETVELCSLSEPYVAHVSHATGNNEWYTPPEYIIAARAVMGSITVDPASSDIANETVQADLWFTKEDDGLKQEWTGNVWMNPPYAQPLVTQFCDLFVEKFKSKEITQGCVLVNNATETVFLQNMLQHCTSICLIKGRVVFLDSEGQPRGAPLQGQIMLYFGANWVSFESIFSKFGVVFHAKR